MDRFYAANVSGTVTPISFPGAYGFTQGAALLPQFEPTSPGAFWFYWYTESVRNVIVAAGLTPDPLDHTQLYRAIQIVIAGQM